MIACFIRDLNRNLWKISIKIGWEVVIRAFVLKTIHFSCIYKQTGSVDCHYTDSFVKRTRKCSTYPAIRQPAYARCICYFFLYRELLYKRSPLELKTGRSSTKFSRRWHHFKFTWVSGTRAKFASLPSAAFIEKNRNRFACYERIHSRLLQRALLFLTITNFNYGVFKYGSRQRI